MKQRSILFLFLVLTVGLQAQSQPLQPASGPGGSDYNFSGVTQFDYGTNGNGQDFWLYEPNGPIPDSANVVVFIHGLGETNPKLYGAFIKHLVRKGNIVIYPRYQKDLNSDNATFSDSCAKGIQRALDTLQQAGHVKPRLQNFFILGHSVGGILTANMSTRYAIYGLPKPLTAFSMQPGAQIAALLLNNYNTMDADIKYLVLVGNDDIIVGTTTGEQLFNETTAIPTSHKNLIKHYADTYGNPDVGATHFEPLAGDVAFDNGESNLFILASGSGPIDAYDYHCTWKLQDALMDCALHSQNCDIAFGDTHEQKFMGNWSDGTPIRPLEVTPTAATAVNEVPIASAFVYPNPASDNCYFKFKIPFSGKLELLDITGKLVATRSFYGTEATIQLSMLSAGVYFYRLSDTAGIVGQGRLVKE